MLRFILNHWRSYRIHGITTPILMIIEVVVDSIVPLIIANLIDVGLRQQQQPVLIHSAVLIFVLGLLALLASGLASFSSAYASRGLAKDLRHDLFHKIQTFSFANYDRFHGSTLITRMTSDVEEVSNGVTSLLRYTTRAVASIVITLSLAYFKSPYLMKILLLSVPVIIAAFIVLNLLIRPRYALSRASLDKINAITQENFRSIREVKGFVREEQQVDYFKTHNQTLYERMVRTFRVMVWGQPLVQIIEGLLLALILYLGGRLVYSEQLEVGTLVVFSSYCFINAWAVARVGFAMISLVQSKVALKRIMDVFDEEAEISDLPDAIQEITDTSIEFKSLHFHYPDMVSDVLSDINLTIEAGESVGIIGSTGSGKSSLVQLIPRLYEASSGAVCVGGIDVRKYSQKALRSQIAIVFQNNTLFSGTVRSNLKIGNPEADDEAVWEALDYADAKSFVEALEDGLDARVESSGTNFSGGQRQRLCIARALLAKPAILIFDDITSSVDSNSQNRIQTAIQEHFPDSTCIWIAQRVSTVKNCDQIIVLNHGHIEAQGKHQDLLESSEVYRSIYDSQSEGGSAL